MDKQQQLFILAEGSFAMMKSAMAGIPGTPQDATEFYRRIVIKPTITNTAPEQPLAKEGSFLSVRAAAARLDVCPRSILNMCRDGRLRHFRAGKSIIKIPESAIADLIAIRQEARR